MRSVLERHEALEPGEESQARYRLAGRVVARRDQGRAAFLDLEDRSGRIQLLASERDLGTDAFADLTASNLGDVVGVEGTAMRTRRGQLSLRLAGFELLARCARSIPKHGGLSDTETRYRQRYLDLLSSPETREAFVRRARIVSALRRALDDDGFVEVETPVLQPIYGGAHARPFLTRHNELERTLYLRIASELYLKRLIVGGLERVYELGKDFRNEGVSFKHNPEFTMLEWYEAYADYRDTMERTERLICAAAVAATGSSRLGAADDAVELRPPWRRVALMDAIAEHSGIDPRVERDPGRLRELLLERGVTAAARDATWAALVDRLLSHFVEPQIREPVFLVDYPVELSPLARESPSDPATVERFEAFCCGMEIANGFSELNDPATQRARFEEQVRAREAGDDEAAPLDEDYLEALAYGLAPTGGCGVGIDRLTMLLLSRSSIRDVLLFPALRS